MNQTKHQSLAPRFARWGVFNNNSWVRHAWLWVLALCALTGWLPQSASGQTTIKPFQIRVEVPVGFAGTLYLSNNVMRVATNGASVVDGTGTNWVIPSINVNITGAPAGVTATPTDLGGNPVTTVPVNMSFANASQSTNLFVKLTFDGTQAGGTSTLSFNANGAVTNDYVLLTLEVAKIWNGAANALLNGAGNWSDSSKWLGGVPGPGDNVVFSDPGTQTNTLYANASTTNLLLNSIVDNNYTISSLRFAQTNGLGTPLTNNHNLFINPGKTLTINGNDGFKMLRDYTFWTPKITVSISGTNGTLVQSNENSSFTLLCDGANAANAFCTLDMSRLGNLSLDVNQVNIGNIIDYPNYQNLITNGYTSGSTLGGSRPQKSQPAWNLAQTNVVKAVYADPYNYTNALSRTYGLTIGHNEVTGGSSGNDQVVSLGYSNAFYMDSICIGAYGSLGAVLNFQNSGSSAVFRGTNGGRMSVFTCGDAAGTASQAAGVNTKCGNSGFGVDFTKGYVDILVDRFFMSMDRGIVTGAGVVQASLGMSSGILDANSAYICYQSSGNQPFQNSCTATLTVSNTAVVKVHGVLSLGYTASSTGDPSLPASSHGILSIGPGGTVAANSIAVGGVTKTSVGNNITMLGNANLIVSNNIADATPSGALGTLSFAGGSNSLTLFVNGTNTSPLVYLSTFTVSGTGNKLVIGGITNLTYPADVTLIDGVGATISASSFDAGVVMPAGSGLYGTLSTSSSNTINLHIINRLAKNIVWRGPAGSTSTADWDYTTKNWLDQTTLLMTNYDNPDVVAFDNTPGYATNINLAGATGLTPTAINMTNSTINYIFVNGPNQIAGAAALNKYGTGNVEIDGSTTLSVVLNQGTLTGASSGSIGNATITAGTAMNYQGTLGGGLTCSGIATSAGLISGTVQVLSGGVVTNLGTVANPVAVLAGGLLVNSGTLSLVGTGSSGSPQVALGGTFINGGTISGDILYVSGTFEDLGGVGSITLTSLSIGPSGTFIPGGGGLGTTTLTGDTTGSFPGALLMSQGSTNFFEVNAGTSASTVLTGPYISFGPSASAQTQNGCFLVISNVSATPFTAGQTFALFNNSFSSGSIPYNTGTSTNTFPVIVPSSPGPGLTWDLSHLWVPNMAGVSGVIGVVSKNSGPALVNSFSSTSTNIVGQFSWDPSYLGYRLETQVNPLTIGLSTNWTGVAGSWTNTAVTLTNVLNGTNCVFYRLAFP